MEKEWFFDPTYFLTGTAAEWQPSAVPYLHPNPQHPCAKEQRGEAAAMKKRKHFDSDSSAPHDFCYPQQGSREAARFVLLDPLHFL